MVIPWYYQLDSSSVGFGKAVNDPFIIEAVKKEQGIPQMLKHLGLQDLQQVSDAKVLIKKKGGMQKFKETLSTLFTDVDNAWQSAGVYDQAV